MIYSLYFAIGIEMKMIGTGLVVFVADSMTCFMCDGELVWLL